MLKNKYFILIQIGRDFAPKYLPFFIHKQLLRNWFSDQRKNDKNNLLIRFTIPHRLKSKIGCFYNFY